MATPAHKQDSNITGLSYAQELTLGALPVTPIWYPLEPNSYNNFGGNLTTIARNPINSSRQRKKGVVTDLDASGGFNSDLTQTNTQDILQGCFFASLRTKSELACATVDGTGEAYTVASGGGAYLAGDLLWAKGFVLAANNGLKHVASSTATDITVSEDLVTATTQSGIISKVGFKFAAAAVTITNSGSAYPVLTRVGGAKDLTTLGLVPGEWIYIGGDGTNESFATAANNGFARVKTVTATVITFDKTENTMVTDAGTGKVICLFFGRVLKNETGTNIVRRSYQLERTLGAEDQDAPTQIQSEYLTGALVNEFSLKLATADKATFDMTFVGTNFEQRSGATGVKTGTRVALAESDAFNTSSDVTRINMSVLSTTAAAPLPLFAFVQEMTITVNNNVSPNKAIGVLGAFDVTAGTFEVGGSVTAYFADVAGVVAVRENSDITFDIHVVKANTGISIDIPLITLGDGRPNVTQDQAITLPLNMAAATGAKWDANMNHTLLMVFFDYLPDLAE